MAQLNFTVGAIQANAQKIIDTINSLSTQSVDLIVFPELTLTSYPPEDLLFRQALFEQVEQALASITDVVGEAAVVIGLPHSVDGKVYNQAVVIRNAEIIARYNKWELPNYSVFDEKRYFTADNKPVVVEISDVKVGLTICEDIWFADPMDAAVEAGADLIVNLNASPFHVSKLLEREAIVAQRVADNKVPVVYVNLVGGQDELVFDGASFVMDRESQVVSRLASFAEEVCIVEFDTNTWRPVDAPLNKHPSMNEAIYEALVLGVRDYVRKSGFSSVVLGLSGGIDSALTLVVAVDALGAENVEAVMLPTRYTSDMSLEDAKLLADRLSVEYKILPIESVYESMLALLDEEFAGTTFDATEENIQARIRGTILMGISNKKGKMVLTTGNKSEMAVGYSTLYGDMAGGYDVLKDVPKTRVFEVSRYCNRDEEVIPQRIIDRPPSAELRDDQKDEDSLPPYDILDGILERYIDLDMSVSGIVAAGFSEELVHKVTRMVDINEYKRRQAPPGVKITPKAFGRDRRYPISSGFRDKG